MLNGDGRSFRIAQSGLVLKGTPGILKAYERPSQGCRTASLNKHLAGKAYLLQQQKKDREKFSRSFQHQPRGGYHLFISWF
jgi:hypothetical protein